jgi:hypothetical protein
VLLFVFFFFSLSASLLFHFAAILLVDFPPQGSACCEMKIPTGLSSFELPMVLVLGSSSVLGCVDAVSSSDAWLGLGFMPRAFEATIVQSSLQSLFNILFGVGTGVFNIEKQVITLLFKSYAVPPCHACCGPGFAGKRVFPTLLMDTLYPAA